MIHEYWPEFLQLPSKGPRARPWLMGLGQMVSVPVGSGEPELGPETLPFDDALPWPGVGDNRGCFPGYFAQRVAPGEPDSSQPASIGIVQGGSVAVRCRRMADYTAAINAQETGQAAAENWYQSTKSVGDFFGKVGLNIGTGLQTLASYAIVGAALYFFILREQRRR